MISDVQIVLQGLPERVQRIADAIESALPGNVDWQVFADQRGPAEIRLEGVGVTCLELCEVDYARAG